MYELQQDGQILKIKEVPRQNKPPHRVGTHETWGTHIHASLMGNLLSIELRRPVIEKTDFKGQLVEEDKNLSLTVDDSEPLEIEVKQGIAEYELDFEAEGEYVIRLQGEGCQGAEVIVGGNTDQARQ